MAWVPLESNPEVMTKLLHKLGVPQKWGLVDVYGLDRELLDMLPKPVLSLILLYPISPKTEPIKLPEAGDKEKEIVKENLYPNVYHLIQYVSNACGTIALIHSVANNLDQIKLEDGYLKTFLDETKDLNSSQRGEKLVESYGISVVHEDFAQEGQTDAPKEEEKVFYHFVAFVEKDGSIYELDGRKPAPINHGPSSKETFIDDSARVCQEYMDRDPEEVRFTMIALVNMD